MKLYLTIHLITWLLMIALFDSYMYFWGGNHIIFELEPMNLLYSFVNTFVYAAPIFVAILGIKTIFSKFFIIKGIGKK